MKAPFPNGIVVGLISRLAETNQNELAQQNDNAYAERFHGITCSVLPNPPLRSIHLHASRRAKPTRAEEVLLAISGPSASLRPEAHENSRFAFSYTAVCAGVQTFDQSF